MYSISEIMQFVQENDVKFIRLSFCEGEGRLKNISIMPHKLQRVLGEGQVFDASILFSGEKNLRLVIDPATLMAMPWRPSQGRVIRFFCELYNLDGTHFAGDYRYWLKNKQSLKQDVECSCPFYLYKTDENGNKTQALWDSGGYFDVSPFDRGENIRRELCLSLEEMKIPVLASYHGEHCGQNVVAFSANSISEAADYIVAFKFAAQSIALRNGLYACFENMPNAITLSCSDGKKIVFNSNLNPYIQLARKM